MDPTEADMANLSPSYPLTPPSAPPNTRAVGSPTLGTTDLQPLQTEKHFSQSLGAPISRPNSPFPFSRQFSSGSQHGLSSTQSSPDLRYLSPPIIDSGGETPPYKPDQDDYFSLNMLGYRRKRKTGLRRSDRSESRDASGSGSTPLLTIDEMRSQSPDALPLRESEEVNGDGDMPNSGIETQIWTGDKSPGQIATDTPFTPIVRKRRPRGFLGTRMSSDPTFSNVLVSSDATEFKSGESSPELSSTIRIWSTRFSNAKRRRNNASEGSGSVKGKRRFPGKLETPATIVLTKASVLCGATFAVTEHGLQTPGASVVLSTDSQVVTSDTSEDPLDQIVDLSVSHAHAHVGPSPLTQQEAPTHGDAGSTTQEKPEPEMERVKTAERIFATSSLTRQRTALYSAITFAEVNTAPRSFSIATISRRSSLSPIVQLRRQSAAHVSSRSSVHEIIWNEDDLSSDDLPRYCSSDEADSPSPPLCRINIGTEGMEDNAGSRSPVFAENLTTSPPNFSVSEIPRTMSLDNADGKRARTSSHKRRTPHSAPQRRLSQHGSDASKIRERKPSLLSRRLSTVFLWRPKEGPGPTIDSAPDIRSADTPLYFTDMPGRAANGFVPLTLTAEQAAEEPCRHEVQKSYESRTDNTGSTFITEPLNLVGTSEARADCKGCKKHPSPDRRVSVD